MMSTVPELKPYEKYEQEEFESLSRCFSRDLNILQDGASTRIIKKKALDRVSKQAEILRKENGAFDFFFQSTLMKALLVLFRDSFECCREASALMMLNYITESPLDIANMMPYLIPDLQSRLGSLKLVENSEEIRFLLLKIANVACIKTGAMTVAYIEQYMTILRRTFQDGFPEVKKVI